MTISILSPCLQCDKQLPGIQCGTLDQSSCEEFLIYIQKLHRIRASRMIISELKNLISK